MTIPEIRKKYEDGFRLVFGVPLSQYWDDAYGGFKMTAFCTQVIMTDLDKWGMIATDMIGAIYADLADYWFELNEVK